MTLKGEQNEKVNEKGSEKPKGPDGNGVYVDRGGYRAGSYLGGIIFCAAVQGRCRNSGRNGDGMARERPEISESVIMRV